MSKNFFDYELFIFDLDGTLLDSSLDVIDSINEVLNHFDKPKGSDDAIRFSIGGELEKIFSSALDSDADFDFAAAEELFITTYHNNCANKASLFPNATELLNELKKQNKRIALFTTKENKDTIKVLEHLNIKHMFEIIVARQDVDQAKPHPEGLHKILKHFPSINPNDAIMIGDTYYDLAAGHYAQLDTMIVKHGYDRNVLNHPQQPTRVISNYSEVLEEI